MRLLIVRHGVAEDKEAFAKTGTSDDERPLTNKGRKTMKRAARGLHTIAPEIGLLATSPLLRAKQTADIVAAEYAMEVGDVADVLRPARSFDSFVKWLKSHADHSVVAVVGHEPHLSGLATWLMCGDTASRLELAKGGACLLSFDETPRRERGTLCWLLTSKQLAALA